MFEASFANLCDQQTPVRTNEEVGLIIYLDIDAYTFL